MRAVRLVALLSILTCVPAAPASADWLITPFLGYKFGGATNFVDLEEGAENAKGTVGASVAILGEGIFGVEADIGYTPGFFQRRDRGDVRRLILSSRVTTLSGGVVVAAPLRLTRESLRPYLVAGVGMMDAKSVDLLGLTVIDNTFTALHVGGGAIGFLAPDVGLRFDLRTFKNVSRPLLPLPPGGTARLRFWRASAGVTIRLDQRP